MMRHNLVVLVAVVALVVLLKSLMQSHWQLTQPPKTMFSKTIYKNTPNLILTKFKISK